MLTSARPSRRFCSRALPRLHPGPPSRSQFIGADSALIGPNTVAGHPEASHRQWHIRTHQYVPYKYPEYVFLLLILQCPLHSMNRSFRSILHTQLALPVMLCGQEAVLE